MVLRLVVLELDVQAVLDAHLHLDRVVRLGLLRTSRHMHADCLLVDDAAAVLPRDRHAHKVAQPDVDAVVRLVLLVDAGEFEGVGLGAR